MATRLTQIAVETLEVGNSPNVRVTQVAAETLEQPNPLANARVTQVTVEMLGGGPLWGGPPDSGNQNRVVHPVSNPTGPPSWSEAGGQGKGSGRGGAGGLAGDPGGQPPGGGGTNDLLAGVSGSGRRPGAPNQPQGRERHAGVCLRINLNLGGSLATHDTVSSFVRTVDFANLAPALKRYAYRTMYVDMSQAINPLMVYVFSMSLVASIVTIKAKTQGYYRVFIGTPQVVQFRLGVTDAVNDPLEVPQVLLFSGLVPARVWATQ